MTRHPVPLDPAERTALIAGLHGDPFAVLGPHQGGVRVLAPGARGHRARSGRRAPRAGR